YSFSNNHKGRPSPFDGDGDGGGFSEGDEKVRVNGFAASHTHVLSSTLINEARFGVGREHTFRLQPNGDDTSNVPGRYGILGIPQLNGNGGLPLLQIGSGNATGSGNLSDLGHASWVVSERFSNTAQFSDNLTKVYKSHAFKGGYMYQYIFFGSTQPPYARGEYIADGRYTSVVNQADNTTARAQVLLSQIPSTVPGGVDFLGGLNILRASPFGSVDAFKTYHGAYAQDNYPFQYTLVYQAPNDTTPNRLPDGSLVGLDARDHLSVDPLSVNANGLTLRGVEYDYQTPRYHSYNVTLQTEVIPQHSVEVGFVG